MNTDRLLHTRSRGSSVVLVVLLALVISPKMRLALSSPISKRDIERLISNSMRIIRELTEWHVERIE